MTGAGRSFDWTSYNYPTRIDSSGGNFSEWLYGPERQRIRQLNSSAGKGDLVYYVGSLYEEHRRGATVEMRNYIATPEGVIGFETWWSTGTVRQTYLHKDHIGSVDAVTDESGNVVQRLSYDAFGKRRGGNWSGTPGTVDFATGWGFTGHEMLDSVGLIHMNGRVYDPQLARFISADPVVQGPELSQSYNRYSYVMNNPLSMVDPSGFSWVEKAFQRAFNWLGNNLFTLIAIAITVAFPPSAVGFWGAVGVGFAAGLVASGGDLRTAFISGAAAGLFYGVGTYYEGLAGKSVTGLSLEQEVSKVFAHGFVGGTSSLAQGGKFGAGFVSAAVPQAATRFTPAALQAGTPAGRIVTAAVIGGTAAELGGGKFANGAVTGAFGAAFNDALHPTSQASGQGEFAAMQASNPDLIFDSVTGDVYRVDANGDLAESWSAKSGPWGNGRLPDGNYTIGAIGVVPSSNPQQASYCDGSGSCWFAPITPQFSTTRTSLGIHPDGGVPGTLGCIGIRTQDTSRLYNSLKTMQGGTIQVGP